MNASSPTRRARRAGSLAYPLGFVSGLVSLVAFADDPFARFHAWQSVLLTVVAVLMIVGLYRVPLIGSGLALFVGASTAVTLLWLTAEAWRGRWTILPLVGDIAARRAR